MWCLACYLFTLVQAGAEENPFAQHDYYVNPVNQHEYDGSIESASNSVVKSNLETMREIASAYWIDKKNKIRGNTTKTVEGILKDAASRSPPQLVVLIWYDFPNRDCAAAASAGEICCAYKADRTCDWGNGGDCAEGIEEYKTGYVDPFIAVLSEYKHVPIVIVFEPDSLPNFATNLGKPHCGSKETQRAYKEGAKYALTELTSKTDATVYIDAAHGGWLGWDNNMMKFMATLKELKLPLDKIRGFSTNVAGYQPLGVMCPWQPDSPSNPHRNGFCLNRRHRNHPCCEDPCGLLSQYDPADNELNYAQELHHAAKGELGMDARIIIDTGRNGVPGPRDRCANWCNIRGAGAGYASTAEVPDKHILDAFFYLKTPGESDGCTRMLPDGSQCPRFDIMCGSQDSIGSSQGEPRAPEAGGWFDYQVKQLAENAVFEQDFPTAPPTTSAPPSPTPTPTPPSPTPTPTPPSPTPTPPGPPGSCCWGTSCHAQYVTCETPPGWCSQSKNQCTGNCNGLWCAQGGAGGSEDATVTHVPQWQDDDWFEKPHQGKALRPRHLRSHRAEDETTAFLQDPGQDVSQLEFTDALDRSGHEEL